MTLTDINLNAVIAQFVRHQVYLIRICMMLLTVYLIFFMAEITWQLIPEASPTAAAKSQSDKASNSTFTKANIKRIKDSNIFGSANTAPKKVISPVVNDAPQTKLNVNLTGTVYSNEEDKGLAVIENRGVQNNYSVGEKIEGTNATIKQIFADRVIIRNGIRNETLMLDGVDFKKMVEATTVKTVANTTPKIPNKAKQALQRLKQSPESFVDFLSVSRVPQGIRVAPGKDTSLFKLSGLKSGDIVTELNGLDLTDMSQLGEAMMAMRSSTLMQLTVKRGEEYLSVDIELPESQE